MTHETEGQDWLQRYGEQRDTLIAANAYDPADEKDSCGVGLVAQIDGTPRREIVELIGEEWQSCPVLVLAADSRVPEELEGDVVTSRGRRAISATKAILRYLAVSRRLPLPH